MPGSKPGSRNNRLQSYSADVPRPKVGRARRHVHHRTGQAAGVAARSDGQMRKAFDYARLSLKRKRRTTSGLSAEQAEAAVRFRTNAYVFDQMSGVHTFLPQLLIAFHRVDDASDMEGYINRIRESGRALRELIEISKKMRPRASGRRVLRTTTSSTNRQRSSQALRSRRRAPTALSGRMPSRRLRRSRRRGR